MKMSFLHPYRPLILGFLVGAALGAALGYFGQCTSGTCPFTATWWRGALYGGVLGLVYGAALKFKKQASEPIHKPSALKPPGLDVAEAHEPPDAGK